MNVMIVLLSTDTDLQCFALDKTFPGWRFAYPGYVFSPNDSRELSLMGSNHE